ncbi:MAG: hypothetical protein K0S32_3455 [Bacteroidetes bacterium]|jgi:hypothetical protein|nr:hypothetical protein [Bacteroidota bacterium]
MKTIISRCVIASILYLLFIPPLKANSDSVDIRVHFLHGSKPKKKYRFEEDRWFGGVLGGHAGIEYEPNKIVNFQPKSRFHIFHKKGIINSKFSIHDTLSFYEILGGKHNQVKKTIITIRISAKQKLKLDSVVKAYTERSPYDYAFFGMRCGAAAYDILAQIGVVYKYSYGKTWRKIFYPRKLRRKLEWFSKICGHKVRKVEGSTKRIWEED